MDAGGDAKEEETADEKHRRLKAMPWISIKLRLPRKGEWAEH